MYTLHFDIDNYFKDAQRAFDSEGIITQKGEYHALTISVYGTMCADEFKKNGDSVYYHRVINQGKYFTDTTKLIFLDNGNSIGLPYLVNYKEMKAPWYSGLTQGVAASFLLRYYELTKDESALELAEKVVRHMLKPESEGGTIGMTKEGCTWIEEYPNSKGSKSVLNGFVNGLVGLKEYVEYFPNDTAAKNIHDECYESLFETIEYYDKPAWTSYSRNGGSISNFYIRLQIQQFDHLYQIYNDERFRLEMKLWSKFAFNKIDKAGKFYKKKYYQFSEQLKKGKDGYIFSDFVNFKKALQLYQFNSKSKISSKNIQAELPVETYHVELVLADKFKKKFTVEYLLNDQLIEKIKYKNIDSLIYTNHIAFDELKIKLNKRSKKNSLPISLRYYNYKKQTMPMFIFINDIDQEELVANKRYYFKTNEENLTNAEVFFRYSNEKNKLKTQNFTLKDTFKLSGIFVPEKSGFYEFFIAYDVTQPNSFLKEIEFLEINN